MKRDLIDFDEVFGDLGQEEPAAAGRHRPTYRQGLDTVLFGTLILAYWLGALWFGYTALMA